MVVLVPEPEIPDNPITVGVDEIVQVPVGGKLLSTTLPVVEEHVTLEIAPIVAAKLDAGYLSDVTGMEYSDNNSELL